MKKLLTMCTIVIPLSACVQTPDQPGVEKTVWLDQGWTEEERQWFHHVSQGTATFPVSYEMFMELEQPIATSDWFNGEANGKFSDPAYLGKFGFIPGVRSVGNPDRLSVGFAKTPGMPNSQNRGTYNAIGLTCAGCHTGEMTYENNSIRIDGGPAMIDLDLFGKALVLAMIETRNDPTRRERFKKAVVERIKAGFPEAATSDLEARFDLTFEATVMRMEEGLLRAAQAAKHNVKAGFTRLDALNRIGNRVFGKMKPGDAAPTSAPVNYPHLWSTSWFDWVQYDGSIMQPMTRNAGEAMGVGAWLQLQDKPGHFDSSIPVNALHEIESLLAGEHPLERREFSGLKAPKWPEEILGKPGGDKTGAEDRIKKGEELYEELCVQCHRPAVKSNDFWSDKIWKKLPPSGTRYYAVKIVPAKAIGTDSAQSKVLATREVDLSDTGIEGEVCLVSNGKMTSVEIKAAPKQSFALALGLAVEKTTQHYYRANNVDPDTQRIMNGDRLNCLQADIGYKARPLNGIWATAPFLHNGSVATLYELLGPVSERAKVIYLGYRGFDPERVGYISKDEAGAAKGEPFLSDTTGLTKVVVAGEGARPGNFNTGHEFSDDKGPGVIGRSLREDERWALVEYLKTL